MRTWVTLVTAILLVISGLVAVAPGEVVGRLTAVEGRVDLLKGGQLPANPAKLEDPVELGDVLRTKSLSKANITFVDNTVLTISPESRIAIESYMFDPAKGKRNAVLELFQGMALAVVSKIYKTEQPDFIVKTHTAIMGVRGTEVGIRLGPNESTFLNFEGRTRVANLFPEVSGDLFKKAAKVAYSFDQGYVDLKDMQATTVTRGLPPTLPYGISIEDRQMFFRQLVVSLVGPGGGGPSSGGTKSGGASSPTCSPTTGTCSVNSSSTSSDSGTFSTAASTVTGSSVGTPGGPIIVTPNVPAPTLPPPSLASLAFTQAWTGPGAISVATQPTASFYNTGPGSGSISSLTFDPGSASISFFNNGFTVSSLAFQATSTTPSTLWNPHWTGTFNSTASGNLSGPASGSLTGTMNMTLSIPGAQTLTLQGPISYNAGTLTFNFSYVPPPPGTLAAANIFTTNGGSPRGIVTAGSWTQVKK